MAIAKKGGFWAKIRASGEWKTAAQNFYPLAAFAFVLGYTFFFLLVPFFQHNNLFNYDMSGMYFSSWYTANYLFPNPIGWNPYFFFGFPQSQFYGPLYPYLTSILALAMPIDAAFKTVLALALLLTPVSFYFFSRSFALSRNSSTAIMLLMFGLLFAFPDGDFGGNINATFGAGFVSQALALPLFFFYFGSLKRKTDSLENREENTRGKKVAAQKKQNGKNIFFWLARFFRMEILAPSILLALIVLSHTLSAVAGLFVPLAFLMARPDKKTFAFLAAHIALAFLLTAFWAVPAAAKMGYAAVNQLGNLAWNAELLAAGAILILLARWKNEKALSPALFFAFAILAFALIGKELGWPVHFYRFTMLIYLMGPIVLFTFVKFSARNRALHIAAVAIAFAAVFSLSGLLHPEGYSIVKKLPPLQIPGPGPAMDRPNGPDRNAYLALNERTIVDAPLGRQSNMHEFPEMAAMGNRLPGVVGVFSESSRNSRYAFDLSRELDGNNPNWGVATDDGRVDSMGWQAKQLGPGQLARLGIKYVLTSSPPLQGWALEREIFTVYLIGGKPLDPDRYSYSLYRTNNAKIIEVLDFVPRRVAPENWENEAADWFLSPQVGKTVLVDEQVPPMKGDGSETVEILGQSPSMETVRFRVNSTGPVPVLIKISQFPNWRAYSGGKELHIYRASPYFMLVYGNGEIELRYEDTWSDTLGHALTLAGIGACAFIAIGSRKPGKNEKPRVR